MVQAITIDDELFEPYRQGSDFIQRFIFPGGCLPSVSVLAQEAQGAGMEMIERIAFGASYATTLQEWRRRFLQNWPEIMRQGFDEPFRKIWEFYLCYSEAGFRAGTIDVGLVAYGPKRRRER